MFESLLQDIRVGFRVLTKERSFCILAVLVLGIGHLRRDDAVHGRQCHRAARIFFSASGATDERRPDRSAGERSKQQLRQRQHSRPRRITKTCVPAQKSFALMAGYLNGSTINVSYQQQSAALHRRLCDGRFLQDHRRLADPGTRFHRRRQQARRGESRDPRRRNLAARFRRRPEHCRAGVRINGKVRHHHRRDAAEF